ncbi:hypothetical protein LXL04_008109 [Taraxacum kok-saghyz]
MLQIGKTKHDEASIKSRSEKRNTMRHRSREKEDGVDCGSGETLLKERLPVHFLCSSRRNSLTRKLPRFTFVEINFGDGTTCETSVKNFPEKVTGDEFLIQADELEALPAETYCMWRPKADCGSSPAMTKLKKSSSTGSRSKRWGIRSAICSPISFSTGDRRFPSPPATGDLCSICDSLSFADFPSVQHLQAPISPVQHLQASISPVQHLLAPILLQLCFINTDDEAKAQGGEGVKHRGRSWVDKEPGGCKGEPKASSNEQEVWDDSWTVVSS